MCIRDRCWIAYTNPETHRIILDNIQRSPLYGGMLEGVGPRYCPSIEDLSLIHILWLRRPRPGKCLP